MVVISIIALMSSIVLASVGRARDKARSAKVVVETQQLKNALELYASNNSGRYPLEDAPNWYYDPSSDLHPLITTYIRTFPLHSSNGEYYYITATEDLPSYPCNGRTYSKYLYLFYNSELDLNLPELDGNLYYYCLGV